jgi:N-hydroxyarylamine O-acetyltransferase
VDLDAYFRRIGWTGPTTPTSDVLAGTLAHHMRSIPFENIDVLLRRPPQLEIAALEAKLVTARRGGYCYEHSTLFAAMLSELGFTVRMHSARVVMVGPRSTAPRTHMFLSVGDVVLDPGFGGLAPRTPVPLNGDHAGAFQLVRDHGEYALEHDGKRLWVSTLEEDLPIDFEMANHFTATHARSPFTQRLMLRAFTDDGQVRVMNRDVTITRGDEADLEHLADRKALRALVAKYFGFDLPDIETMNIPAVPEWS